jgi:hypothetical protein
LGHEADDLLSIFDTLIEDDIWQFRYPDDASLDTVGVRGIYLGNYVRWDPKVQHEAMVAQHDYWGARFDRTFDTYDHVDCFNFMGLHDHIKSLKHGYSKVTDHACREIRHGRLSRKQAVQLVRHYESRPAPDVDLFCQGLDVQPDSLAFILDQHRGRHIWRHLEDRRWERLSTPDDSGEPATPSAQVACTAESEMGFSGKRSRCLDRERAYIVIGKGFPQ